MRLCFNLTLLFLFTLAAHAQKSNPRDSLLQLLRQAKDDTLKVNLLYEYGDIFVQEKPDSATSYFNEAKRLAQKANHPRGIAAYASHQIVVLNNRGAFKEALQVAREALEIYKQVGDKKELAVAYLNVGSEWHYLADFALAAEYYLSAKKLAEEIDDRRLQRITNNNLASVFIELKEYEKGKRYAQTSLSIAKELKNDYAISSSSYNIATADMHLKRYDEALSLYREILNIGIRTEDDVVKLDGWLGMADAYSAMKKTPEALQDFRKVIDVATEKDMPEYKMYACMGMADLLLKTKQYAAAQPYLDEGISLAEKQGSRLELKDMYLKKADMFEQMGQLQSALDFRKKFENLNDTLLGEKNRALIANLEAKYEFDRKADTIQRLSYANQLSALTISRKNTLNYVLIGGATSLLLLLLLSYRNYKHRQQIQQQRINELETEKQLAATEAVLKGEEQERTRLAKDLHDGLGGMLSGIKYSLHNMKGNLIMTPENAQAFERSIDMLDSSISEMRRVAHNMMPEALVKFGLDTALKDFCNDVNQTGALKVAYQSIGLEDAELEQTKAITIYRIVQELLNNAMKHASATQALVQVSRNDGLITVTVEDDGKGFDAAILKQSKGIGWSNIQNRVDFLKGKWDVDAQPGRGTSVHVELPA